MYGMNIPIVEKQSVCFQSKKVKICRFFYISNNYYIYLKRYFEVFVTNDFFSIFWRTAALRLYRITYFIPIARHLESHRHT